MRVSLGMLTGRVRTNLNNGTAAMLDAQDRLSSGKRIHKPSDDIPGTARALSLRSSISSIEQFSRNAEFAKEQLSVTGTAMDQAVKLIQRAREQAMKAVNGTLNQEAKDGIATQLQSISDQLAGIANTDHLGKSIFAGSLSDQATIVINPGGTPPYLYQGNSTPFTMQVAPSTYMATTVTADMAFNMNSAAVPGTPDIFQTLKDLKTLVTSGTGGEVSNKLKDLDANLKNTVAVEAQVGARLSRLEDSGDMLTQQSTQAKDMLSKIEDVDFADAIIDLQTKQNVYQAAISVASKALQTSLVDYMK